MGNIGYTTLMHNCHFSADKKVHVNNCEIWEMDASEDIGMGILALHPGNNLMYYY